MFEILHHAGPQPLTTILGAQRHKADLGLVAADKEPITPLVDRVTSLTEAGVSLIMVVGGSGAFLDAADRVLMMDNYPCLPSSSDLEGLPTPGGP
ncbi:P-loop domain-containing protein [Aeromonas taiwanensis]|uniref:P-loop domain-containing protein n=1 Tax=Aeromonas taiwanensis TaxID=633417 RepID=UPI003CD0D179